MVRHCQQLASQNLRALRADDAPMCHRKHFTDLGAGGGFYVVRESSWMPVGAWALRTKARAEELELTPREERRPRAEPLRHSVVAVLARTCPAVALLAPFDGDDWHLDELHRRFAVPQRLGQVQNLQGTHSEL